MMSGARNILWLLPLLLFLSGPLWWGPVSGFLAPRGDFEAGSHGRPPKHRTFVMTGVDFTQYRAGERQWQIVTSRLSTEGDESKLRLAGVNALLFDRGKGKFYITSREGTYNTRKKVLALSGDVRVVNKADGYEIRSSRMLYQDTTGKIRAPDRVQLSSARMKVSGTGLDYDMKSGAYRLGGRVRFVTW